jgi:hypothetical protein
MFEVNDDGSVLIKNSAILGESTPDMQDVKKACHALTAQSLVARFQKEAVLYYREEQNALGQSKEELRRSSIAEVAEKSQAKSLDELEQEIQAHILSSQVN